MQANNLNGSDNEMAVNDLGPLAWVLDELRKSLDGATKAIRRFVRDAELARGSDLESLDASQLRIARQQLHQAVGALEMVGLAEPAKVLRAMETLAQKFVQHPEFCSEESAAKVERASFALSEYLEGVLRGKTASSVALFPQYRDVLELLGEERIHPAELWPLEWRWLDAPIPEQIKPLSYGSSVRTKMDSSVLKMVKTSNSASAKTLRDITLGLSVAQERLEPRVFWKIAAAFFEGIALKLIPVDVYVKRAASRVLMHYSLLAKGGQEVSDRLAQDILFFCSQTGIVEADQAPVLATVRSAYGLSQNNPVDYETTQFGRFDPALLVQVRKRIATATETWSALAGGDTNRLKQVGEQFNQVSESLLRLHAENTELSRALLKAVELTVRSGEPPSTPVAMEVATAILYLDAAYEDMDPTDSQMADRGLRLARRLDHVIAGGQPEALESWMEDLYRRVSDRQTMGSVVEELRTALTEIEKSLDTFFRNPTDKVPLHEVPSQLSQMRGVFSVLGLDQASTATLRMRDSVEKFLNDNVEPDIDQSYVFEKLGNSLGALGFLIDMLSYQRALAKKLFVYDDDLGEFKPLMGRDREDGVPTAPPAFRATVPPRSAAPATPAVAAVVPSVKPPTPSAPTSRTVKAAQAAQAASDEDTGEELRDIFLDEAREVIQTGKEAIRDLGADPGNLGLQTTLRRAFHTLKGSSRMVGYTEFGEAAWAMEQMLNSWLAEQKPVEQDLLSLSSQAMDAFHKWVEDISRGADTVWSAAPFRRSADSQRLEHTYLELELPQGVLTSPAPVAFDFDPQPMAGMELVEAPDFDATHRVQFEVTEAPPREEPFQFPTSEPAQALSLDSGFSSLGEIDFGSLAGITEKAPLTQGEEPVSGTEMSELTTDFWSPDTRPGAPDSRPGASVEDLHLSTLAADLSSARTEMGSLEGIQWGSGQEPTRYHGLESADLSHEKTQMQSLVAQVEEDSEEQVKVIGSLRIGIPLYNVYLNEADEWSRQLLTELNEWSLELHRPVSDSSVALAHSLAGSSGTVGFMALSDIARSLEHALQHVQLHGQGYPAHAQIFVAAAENIRHLLHQFAAGFLKEPDSGLLLSLADILSTDFSANDVLSELPDYKPMPAVPARHQENNRADELPADISFDFVMQDTAPGASLGPAAALKGAAPLMGAAQIVDVDRDEEIDAVDNIDPDLFPIFEEEATELLPQLAGALRQWSANPEELDARQEVLRVLHTLKGSARLSGAMRLGEMAHHMETVVEQLGTEVIQHSQVEPLLHRFDRLQQCFDDLRDAPQEQAMSGFGNFESESTAPEFLPADTFDAIPEFAATVPRLAEPAAPAPQSVPEIPVAEIKIPRPMPKLPLPVPVKPIHVPTAARSTSGQSVRVRSQLLDRLVNQAGEVMISRSRLDARLGQLNGSLGELTTNLDRLRGQLRDVEVQSESQMQSRLALAKDTAQGFDPLEFDRFTRVQELTRMMAESVSDVATVQRNLQRTIAGTEDDLIAQGRQARELQRELLRTRMIEFEAISERLYGVVRQVGKETGKQVKLDITGGSLEVDRGVLDRMTPAFEHMLRNSIAHGIEDGKTREAAGKPASGTITIGLSHGGNDVSVTFSDDGAGLNLQRIREKAQSNGLIANGQSLSDDEAANLIFMPGFSTASSVTELSGRGIGMDVVRSEVHALGGRIETKTRAGQGTQFTLVLPLTTAVTQVIMVRMGELTIGVPSNLVDIVMRTKPDDLAKAYETSQVEYGGETLPFFWSGALLQASNRSREHEGKAAPVVVFRSAGQRIAAHVDEVLGNQEVVVKNLGPQLSRLPGLAGMSVLASGAVVLIYNPVALATFYGQVVIDNQLAMNEAKQAGVSQTPAQVESLNMLTGNIELPLVLVVDDSITVRRVTQRLLKREGYRVALANDGLQALERLREERPTLVLSDIEMPRMDGFDLVRNIRNDEKLRDLPVIMITSRIAEKHREHARELGVNHYLGKPFAEDELLKLVRHYCTQDVNA